MLKINEIHILSKTEANCLIWGTDKLGYHDAEIFINYCNEISARLFYGRILNPKCLRDIQIWQKKPIKACAFRGKVFQ